MSQELAIIRPAKVTPNNLVDTDVPEDPSPEWDNGDTYNEGDRAHLTATHKVYESLVDGNVGNDPSADTGTNWVEVGPTNRWKLFDLSISSQTEQADSMEYTIAPGIAFSAIAVLNASSLQRVTVTVDDPIFGEVYQKEVDVTPLPPESTWYAWFFGDRQDITQVILRDLPSYPSADVIVKIDGGSELGVGTLMIGHEASTEAKVLAGASVGIQDFSRKEKDDFGDTILVERAFAKRASLALMIENDHIDTLYDLLALIRATPCLYIFSHRKVGVVYGFFREFDILINYANYSDVALELEGLT